MRVYQSRPSQPLKYVVALIVFILAMCITWTDVFGYETNDSPSGATVDHSGDNGANTQALPTPIPEPGTLILLGGGLGALYLMRKRRNAKK